MLLKEDGQKTFGASAVSHRHTCAVNSVKKKHGIKRKGAQHKKYSLCLVLFFVVVYEALTRWRSLL